MRRNHYVVAESETRLKRFVNNTSYSFDRHVKYGHDSSQVFKKLSLLRNVSSCEKILGHVLMGTTMLV